jgi:hypothetical protein
MDTKTIPAELSIAMEGACALSLECWRLGRIAALSNDDAERAGLRHVARRITDTLKGMGIEAVDFAGRIYDSGMVPDVIEVRECCGLRDGAVIDETVTPTVTWRGQVIKSGQIIVKRTVARPPEVSEVTE